MVLWGKKRFNSEFNMLLSWLPKQLKNPLHCSFDFEFGPCESSATDWEFVISFKIELDSSSTSGEAFDSSTLSLSIVSFGSLPDTLCCSLTDTSAAPLTNWFTPLSWYASIDWPLFRAGSILSAHVPSFWTHSYSASKESRMDKRPGRKHLLNSIWRNSFRSFALISNMSGPLSRYDLNDFSASTREHSFIWTNATSSCLSTTSSSAVHTWRLSTHEYSSMSLLNENVCKFELIDRNVKTQSNLKLIAITCLSRYRNRADELCEGWLAQKMQAPQKIEAKQVGVRIWTFSSFSDSIKFPKTTNKTVKPIYIEARNEWLEFRLKLNDKCVSSACAGPSSMYNISRRPSSFYISTFHFCHIAPALYFEKVFIIFIITCLHIVRTCHTQMIVVKNFKDISWQNIFFAFFLLSVFIASINLIFFLWV